MSYEDLLKKWEPVLEHPEFAQIKDPYKKKVTAILLENQDRDMEESRNGGYGSLREATSSASTNVTGGVDKFDPVLISMIRRSMPNLIAFDVMGVQPMSGPSGLIFAMRSRYSDQSRGDWPTTLDNTNEAFKDEADTAFSGKSDIAGDGTGTPAHPFANDYAAGGGLLTSEAELLGSDAVGAGTFAEMAMTIEKISVNAKSRALKAEYTMELAQDLKAIHNLDAESELANILSTEIMAEINREMIRKINISSSVGALETQNAGIFNLDLDSSGRWSVEKFKGLLFQIERDANAIAKATRRGKGNVIICSSDVASALQLAGVLDYNPALQNALQVDDTGSTFAGVLNGRYKVYIDPYISGMDYYTLGYRGSSPYDAGLFYCPYVPLQMVRAVDTGTFQPKIGFKTRYGLVANPFAQGTTQGLGALTAQSNKIGRAHV